MAKKPFPFKVCEQCCSAGGGGFAEETDPTVPEWAKQPTKPSYTAAEVGAYTKEDTYTKEEVEGKLKPIGNTADRAYSMAADCESTIETVIRPILNEKADKENTYTKTEVDEKTIIDIKPYETDIDTFYGDKYNTPVMYRLINQLYGQGEFLFVYSSARMVPPDYMEEEFATYQVRFTDTGIQYRMTPVWGKQWTEWVSYATTKDIETKTDKTTVEKSTNTAYAFEFSATDNKEVRLGEASSVSFTFGNGEYPEDYNSGLSFDSGATPTAIDYTDSGILNWVGTDCTTTDGLSIFQPSANTHYDIVFYFNGTQFIGLVNGFVPSVSR